MKMQREKEEGRRKKEGRQAKVGGRVETGDKAVLAARQGQEMNVSRQAFFPLAPFEPLSQNNFICPEHKPQPAYGYHSTTAATVDG